MSEGRLTGKRILMVIAPEQFRDEELFETKSVLEGEGAKVQVACRNLATASGMLGGSARPDLLISECSAGDWDAVVVVGGMGSPEHLWPDSTLHQLLQQSHARGGVVGAICLSGAVLARAGLLGGRRATVYKTDESLAELRRGGANYIADDVVTDGQLVTASGPHAATSFGKAIADALAR
jgi:protease I